MIPRIILIGVLVSLCAISLPAQLVLATADTPPYSTDQGTGIYDRVLQNAFDGIDVSLSIRRFPSKRGLLEANQGRVDGEFARTSEVAEEYSNLVQVPTPLSYFDFVAVTRSDTPVPTTFAELGDHHIAFINGWKVLESSVTDFQSLTFVENEEQLFSMLLAGHVNVVLYERLRAENWIRRNRASSLRIAQEPLTRQPMYLLLHRRHIDLVPHIAAELERLYEADVQQANRRDHGATR